MNFSLPSTTSLQLPTFDFSWADLIDFKDSFIFYLMTYAIIAACSYIVSIWLKLYPRDQEGSLFAGKRILFVIAHPDDECMFFGPSIISLTEAQSKNVYLLCLTCGDFRNEGGIRGDELQESCKRLGISSNNVLLMNNSFFLDNPHEFWDSSRLANLLLTHIETYDFDRVVTFDEDGVSKHKNHISIYNAMLSLTSNKKLPPNCKAFALDSVNVFRKYSGILDACIAMLFDDNLFIIGPQLRHAVVHAMYAHKSQLVWFRRLYLIFSRYLLVNGFTEICDDFSLDLL